MGTDFFDGYQSAVLAVARIASMVDRQARQTLLAEALGDLIDVPLNWSNLQATDERLRGFVAVFADVLAERGVPELPAAMPLFSGSVAVIYPTAVASIQPGA
ncbi:hypothetical protein [Stutzerimonas kunmingensis]|uniref:hypothetical protein n=1 Tax=Stutzerimonas kunmingensis TaxID=1211807 RepID=UPI00241DD5CA|nr:hypothetical protein [Stutzerimonas kunmingensis]